MLGKIRTLAIAAMLALTACNDMTPQEGIVFGAIAGVITAQALQADDHWTILAALAGAAIGSLVARNDTTHQCAYARGRGTYRVGPCPVGYYPPHR